MQRTRASRGRNHPSKLAGILAQSEYKGEPDTSPMPENVARTHTQRALHSLMLDDNESARMYLQRALSSLSTSVPKVLQGRNGHFIAAPMR
jgi:hypothetical protein